jgi:hypothetical protein
MIKTALAAFTLLLTFIPHASANFSYTPKKYTPKQISQLGLYLGGQFWRSDINGAFGEESALIDYKLKKEQQTSYFIAVKHPYPFLPNIRIESTSLDTTGKTTLEQAFNFGDGTFIIGDDVNTNFSISYVDYTLFYQLVNKTKFSFDLGLTKSSFNGAVSVTRPIRIIHADCNDDLPDTVCGEPTDTDTPTGKIKTDDIVPMLYIATDLSLPLKNISIFAQGNFSLKGDHSISDYQVGLSYDLLDTKMGDYHLTLGYKTVKMELENLNDLYTDLEFKGTSVGFIAHF